MAKHTVVFLLAALLTLVLFSTTPVTDRHDGYDSDGVVYAMISSMPLASLPTEIVPPFCYRILTPKIAALLPGLLLDRFRVIAVVASILSLVTLYKILARLRFSDRLCGLGVLLYAGVFWSVKFAFYSPAYIDHVSNLFLLLIIYCALSEQFFLALVVLCLSVFQKESLPIFSFYVGAEIWRRKGTLPHAGLRAAATIILPFVCVLVFHRQFGSESPAAGNVVLAEARRFLEPAFWPLFLQASFSGLGLLPVILLARPRPWLRFLRERPAFIVYLLLAAGALLGGIDKSRLFTYALPGVVILTLATIESFETIPVRRALPWLTLFLVGHWYIGNCLTPIGTFSEYLAKLVPEHSLSLGGASPMPYLIRDCLIAAALLGLTIYLLAGNARRTVPGPPPGPSGTA